jgi:hypothetical protein
VPNLSKKFEIIKQKTMLYEVWEFLPRSAMHDFTLFFRLDATLVRASDSRTHYTRRDIIDLFGTGESGNVSLNPFWQLSYNEMPGSLRQ